MIDLATYAMAQVSSSRAPYHPMNSHTDELMGSDIFACHPSATIAPEPLPAFVFPMQSTGTTAEDVRRMTTSSTEIENTGSRRTGNRSRPQQISINALPPFEFHPSNADSTSTTSRSSTHSPAKSLPIPPRVGGHRRGGSEFIGGDGTSTGPGLMSTSPTKSESTLQLLPDSRRGAPGSRRGHAHRRSGAISSQDVSSIIRPPLEPSSPRSGSAPTTPSDPNAHRQFLPVFDRSTSQPIVTCSNSSPSKASNHRESAPSFGQPRPRVGFSDTVEFIPRPLSTISSETSSSLSTIRASHSVTGSISSIISGNTSSPPSTKKTPVILEKPVECNNQETRPKSAGAILDSNCSIPTSADGVEAIKRPSTATASPGALMSDMMAGSRRRAGKTDKALVDDIAAQFSGDFLDYGLGREAPMRSSNNIRRLRCEPNAMESLPISRPRSSPEPKVSKRQKKVKSWAGAILSRKSRSRSPNDEPDAQEDDIPAMVLTSEPSDDLSPMEIDFDNDPTCIIRNPRYINPKPVMADSSNWDTTNTKPYMDSDLQSPVIDLDAALAAPLHTPGSSEDGDHNSQGGFSSAKRRMHSGGAVGGFMGPGMHYHRRAESAPEMASVDYLSFGLHHLGSNSSMADVFEEDEEDDAVGRATQEGVVSQHVANNSELHGLGVQIVDSDGGETGATQLDIAEGYVQTSNATKQQADVNEVPKNELKVFDETSVNDFNQYDTFPVEIIEPSEEPQFSVVTKSSDDSTITPTLPNDQLHSRPVAAPTEYVFPRTSQFFDMPETPSSFSSPGFANTSFDVPRLHTATSSITDKTTWSGSRAGGVGQGSMYSAEDVPSLTSSASTVISSYPPRHSTGAGTQSSGERSMSFSEAVPRRTRPVSAGKRSSLASLSRLVGSSYGEKSKLSIESRAQQDDADKPDKKKGNRISRLMRFWKSKEKLVDK